MPLYSIFIFLHKNVQCCYDELWQSLYSYLFVITELIFVKLFSALMFFVHDIILITTSDRKVENKKSSILQFITK